MTAVPGSGDDVSVWQPLGAFALSLFGIGFGIFRWFLGKIKEIRLENEQAILVLRTEVIARLDRQYSESREDREQIGKFRELILQTMATRTEVERALDRQTQQIVERLDARFSPFEPPRKSRSDG
ncbi:MAG TPA: hypothetical protein VH024_17550 [Candidatus Angelobacter sp.]|jgi:hypothetical protein|nr:hypothetical protein [Candidatus Angelobacter sp.]